MIAIIGSYAYTIFVNISYNYVTKKFEKRLKEIEKGIEELKRK